LRAFTAADRKVIKQTAENYPESAFYKTDELLTQVGIGEALITVLNEKGVPTPLVHCMLRAPQSRMDVLTDAELNSIADSSRIAKFYNETIDSNSAYEILTQKLEAAANQKALQAEQKETAKAQKQEKGFFDNPIVKSVARTAGNTIIRSLLGAIGVSGGSRKKKSWF